MKKMDLENARKESDIDIVERHNVTEVYGLDVFLSIPGLPELCVGFAFEDNQVSMFSALNGTAVEFYVEAPVAAGAALEYTPTAAVRTLLTEFGITVVSEEDDTLHVDGTYPKASSLKDFDEMAYTDRSTTVNCMDDLQAAVEDAYENYAWD